MARRRKMDPECKAFINSLLKHYQPKDAQDIQDMAEIFSRDELDQCSKEVLITLFLNLQEQMIEMNRKLDRLAEQLAVAQDHWYGRKSEKLDVIDGQLCFNFNEAEALLENIYIVEPVDEDVISTVVKRKKKKEKRKEDLSSLPVETISHTLSEEELTDIFGENGWKQLPDKTYMRVKVGPAKYTVEEHHICVYAGKTSDKIVKAFRPKSILRNSIATPSLVASIMNAKYVNGMLLDRIATDLRRNDVNISKQVIANWVIRCSERYLSPVYQDPAFTLDIGMRSFFQFLPLFIDLHDFVLFGIFFRIILIQTTRFMFTSAAVCTTIYLKGLCISILLFALCPEMPQFTSVMADIELFIFKDPCPHVVIFTDIF